MWNPEAGRWEMEAGSGKMGEIPKKRNSKFQIPKTKFQILKWEENQLFTKTKSKYQYGVR
jgi:DMSO/TMAO reductase YedYZ molybdopterin-dependent catalytic subunit